MIKAIQLTSIIETSILFVVNLVLLQLFLQVLHLLALLAVVLFTVSKLPLSIGWMVFFGQLVNMNQGSRSVVLVKITVSVFD